LCVSDCYAAALPSPAAASPHPLEVSWES
ncbi:hypothetical protein A2U01_0034999, partial [Trifolium medium]|nr:hypothetical protein [Trifolium medium]